MSAPTALRRDLAASRARLLQTISGVTEEQFKRRPADGGWCIAEVLAYLLASERLAAQQIRRALENDGGEFEAVEPEGQARAGRSAPVPQLIHGLLASRREIETLLDRAESIAGGLERQAGAGSISSIVAEQVTAHEGQQVERIEALKAQF